MTLIGILGYPSVIAWAGDLMKIGTIMTNFPAHHYEQESYPY